MQIKILGYKDELAYKSLRLQGLQINPESFSSSYKEVAKWSSSHFTSLNKVRIIKGTST